MLELNLAQFLNFLYICMYIVLVPVRDPVGKSKSDGQAMTNEQYANRFVEWNIGGVALLSGRQDQGMLLFSFFLLCFLLLLLSSTSVGKHYQRIWVIGAAAR
jgi:hypothetical protein